MIRRDKFKLSIWVLAIISVVLFGNVAFAEEMIPKGVIKSDYVVGEKSAAEHVYYGEFDDLRELDKGVVLVEVQYELERDVFKLKIENEKIKSYLDDVFYNESYSHDMYKFYLKQDIEDGVELAAIEKIQMRTRDYEYCLTNKTSDGWIFACMPEDIEESRETKRYENYFRLELSDSFKSSMQGLDIDKAYEELKFTSMSLFLDEDQRLDGIYVGYDKYEEILIENWNVRLGEKPLEKSEPITIIKDIFEVIEKRKDDATIMLDGSKQIVDLRDFDGIIEEGKEYRGNFLDDNKLLLLSLIDKSISFDIDEDILDRAENIQSMLLVESIDEEDNKVSCLFGHIDNIEYEFEELRIPKADYYYVIDTYNLDDKSLLESSSRISNQRIKIEPGQIIYTEDYKVKDGEKIHDIIVLKNPEKYHVNDGINTFSKTEKYGEYDFSLELKGKGAIDISNVGLVAVKEGDTFKNYEIEHAAGIYDLEKEFDLSLILSERDSTDVFGIIIENAQKKSENEAIISGKVTEIESDSDGTSLEIDTGIQIKKLLCTKGDIDVTGLKAGDYISGRYLKNELYEIKKYDGNISTKYIRLSADFDIENQEMGFIKANSVYEDYKILNQKMWDDIAKIEREKYRRREYLIRASVLDDELILDYELLGRMDDFKAYRLLDHDEDSIKIGFGARVDTLNEDFTQDQIETLDFSEIFEWPNNIDGLSDVMLILNNEGDVDYIQNYSGDIAINYSNESPSGEKTLDNRIVTVGLFEDLDKSRNEIEVYLDCIDGSFDFETSIESLDLYEVEIDANQKKVLELDSSLNSIAELEGAFDVKKVSDDDDEKYYEIFHDLDDAVGIAEIKDGELKAIARINVSGNGLKGVLEENRFVSNEDKNQEIQLERDIFYDGNTYYFEDFEQDYKTDVEAILVKSENAKKYYTIVTKAERTVSEDKKGIFILDDMYGRTGPVEFIDKYGIKSFMSSDVTGNIDRDYICENFEIDDIVRLNYQRLSNKDLVINSMELVKRPLELDTKIYRVKEINGLDITLETGTIEEDENGHIQMIETKEKIYESVENAAIFGLGRKTDLVEGAYTDIKLNSDGKIELFYLLDDNEVINLSENIELEGEYLIVSDSRLNRELEDGEMEIESIENGDTKIVGINHNDFAGPSLGKVIDKAGLYDTGEIHWGIENLGKSGVEFVKDRKKNQIITADTNEKLDIEEKDLIKCYYNGKEVEYSDLNDFDENSGKLELCKWTKYDGKVIYLELFEIEDLGVVVTKNGIDKKIIKIKNGDVEDLDDIKDYKVFLMNVNNTANTYLPINDLEFYKEKQVILYGAEDTAFAVQTNSYRDMKSLKPLFESSDSSFDEYGIKLGQEMDSLEYDDTKVKEMDKNRGFEDGEFWIIECTSEANSENIKAVILENDESKIKTDIKLADNYIVVRAKEQLEKGSDYYMTIVLEDGSVYKSNLGCVEE